MLSYLFIDTYAQINTFGENTDVKKDYNFALRLMPSLNGSLVQTAILKEKSDGKYEVQYVPLEDWVRQIIGAETSKANPEQENLIKKYNVFEIPGENQNEEINTLIISKLKVIINNLWRIKYAEYPFYNPNLNQEKGWALNENEKITWMPSESQIQLLKPYGINNLSDFFIGEHLFDFLKDVTNRDWQNRYIQSAGVYHQK